MRIANSEFTMSAKKSKKENKTKSIVIIGIHGFKGHHILKRLETNPKYKKVIAIDIKKPNMTLKKNKVL